MRLTLLAPEIPACSLRFATTYPRVSNDTPSENAFCCVAPGVRLSDFAILATGVFWRASVLSSRTSSLVHSRRFAFFAIFTGSNVFKSGFLTQHYRARQRIFIAPAGTLNKHRRASPNKVEAASRLERAGRASERGLLHPLVSFLKLNMLGGKPQAAKLA